MQYRVELGPDVYGNITRLDNALAGISEEITESEEKLRNLKTQLENAQEEVAKPFAQEQELKMKTARLSELNILLNLDKAENADTIGQFDVEKEQPDMQKKMGKERSRSR